MIQIILFPALFFLYSCQDNEETPLPLDCAGVEGGTAQYDSCGVCDTDSSNDCVQDCTGEWGGVAVLDMCGVCNGVKSTCMELRDCDLNTADFSDIMTLTAKIDILIDEQSTSDSLYAFVGESCRGSTSPILQNESFIYYLTVYGNATENDSVVFYYYQTGIDLLWLLEQSVLFSPYASFGNPSDPFIFTRF